MSAQPATRPVVCPKCNTLLGYATGQNLRVGPIRVIRGFRYICGKCNWSDGWHPPPRHKPKRVNS